MKKTVIATFLSLSLSASSFGQNFVNDDLEAYQTELNQPKKCKPWQAYRKRELLKKLPEEKRSFLYDTMSDAKAQAKPIHQEIKGIKRDLKGLLTAEEFDESAFTAKSSEIGPKKKELARLKRAAVIKVANSFDQDERKILAKVLKIKCHKGHKRQPRRIDGDS